MKTRTRKPAAKTASTRVTQYGYPNRVARIISAHSRRYGPNVLRICQTDFRRFDFPNSAHNQYQAGLVAFAGFVSMHRPGFGSFISLGIIEVGCTPPK